MLQLATSVATAEGFVSAAMNLCNELAGRARDAIREPFRLHGHEVRVDVSVGIAIAPDGTYWIASEGNASGSRPNRLLQVSPDGSVLQEIGLPTEVENCRQAENDAGGNTGTLGSGFEGVAVQKTWKGKYRLLIAQQRGWDYRLRLKGNLVVFDGPGKTTTGQCASATTRAVTDPSSSSTPAQAHRASLCSPRRQSSRGQQASRRRMALVRGDRRSTGASHAVDAGSPLKPLQLRLPVPTQRRLMAPTVTGMDEADEETARDG